MTYMTAYSQSINILTSYLNLLHFQKYAWGIGAFLVWAL